MTVIMPPLSHVRVFAIVLLSLSLSCTLWAQTDTCKSFPQPADICVGTQGDSATPQTIPVPLVKSNKDQVTVEVGPLSPIESCSLTSITSAPSTTTSEASLARLIGILLGTTISAPTVPSGPVFYPAEVRIPSTVATPQKSPASDLLDKIDADLSSATSNFTLWINRRQAALSSLDKKQSLFTLAARTNASGTPPNNSTVKDQMEVLAECLNEDGAGCSEVTPAAPAIPEQTKLSYEGSLQTIASYLAAVPNLLKAPTEPSCEQDEHERATAQCKSKEDTFKQASQQYQDDQTRLFNDQASLAVLQNDDAKLRAAEGNLATLYAQAYKVLQHVNSSNLTIAPSNGELFESLSLVPGEDSDVTASLTCTSVVDNSTTLGPVPISIHAGLARFVFSAGGVISLTPNQTLGEVQVPDTSTAGFHTIEQQTGFNSFQVIPFAFETLRLLPWKKPWKNKTITGFGITGGIGFNPYPGVQGIDFFSGGSIRFINKIYFHCGVHSGRYVYPDPHSGFEVGDTLPSGFPTSVPTVARFTHHLAFGVSYSF